jgi:uncharacterized protein YrrD
MLVHSNFLTNKQIVSISEGKVVASVSSIIIDPSNLSIVALYCSGPWSPKKRMVVLTQDIKTIQQGKIIINTVSDITELEDIVRLKEIAKINFSLISKNVKSESRKKLGKINDYSINIQNFYIQKITVSLSIFRSLGTNTLLIDREQIIEVSDHEVIVSDTILTNPSPIPQQA